MRGRNGRQRNRMGVRWDLPALILLVSNAVTIYLALTQNWNVVDLVVVYWAQSVTIGFFNWRLLRFLEGQKPRLETRLLSKHSDSWFFALHYGLFHFVYMVFLAIGVVAFGLDSPWVIIGILAFGVNQAVSYWYSIRDERTRKLDPSAVFFLPYARILPMHLTIILGAFFAFYVTPNNRLMLLFFLVLKTAADVIMYFVERSTLERKSEAVIED